MNRRTTVSADAGDLAVLEAEARRRGVALTRVLGEAVAREADRLRRRHRPRFGIVEGRGDATELMAADEHAPARDRPRS